MPRWDRACEDEHVHEVYFSTYREAEQAFANGIPCETCGKPTHTKISFDPKHGIGIIYNCGGFYGNVPTDLAHNTGQI